MVPSWQPVALITQLRRALYSPLGRTLAQRSRVVVKPLLVLIGMRRHAGSLPLEPGRPTLVVVSHEASATGAPILALNLCQELSSQANIVVLLLRGGALIPDFQSTAVAVLQPRLGLVFSALLRREFQRLLGPQHPRYALVNSVVSAGCIQPLRSLGIPTLTLIHEFSAYIRPLDLLNNVGLWSSRMVFSSPLTRNDVLHRCPQLQAAPIEVLPQGPCRRPDRPGRQGGGAVSQAGDASAFLANLDPNALLVLGAGEIQPRKGVDLFIAVADQLRQRCPDQPLQFAWIGSGYDPLYDFSVSLWLDDQIQRSGLNGQLRILDHSPAYGELLERADLFLVTSRLDPLPNVAIDALLAGKPMLCFERACGMANLLLTDPLLGRALVAPYFNTAAMAEQAAALVQDPAHRLQVAQQGQRQAERWFNMTSYVEQLRELGEQAAREQQNLQRSLQLLLKLQAIQPDFGFTANSRSPRAGTEHYLLAWRTGIWPRKPFPGFHPGIYRDQQLSGAPQPDPLLHYLEAGRPNGPWHSPLITPASPSLQGAGPRTALHIHVHYPELLPELLQALSNNQLRPDLFLSCSNATCSSNLEEHVAEAGFELKQLLITPNRGRDLGPLLSELGQTLDRHYPFHGHLHTKKSALIGRRQADQWRLFLNAHLLGSPETAMADRIVAALQADPQLGLVFPDDPTCVGWSANRAFAEPLAARLGLGELPNAFDFPVGTMFWARQGALAPLYNLKLHWNDYPPEPLGYDGTLLHAIERLLPLVAKAQGYGYALSHVPGVHR